MSSTSSTTPASSGECVVCGQVTATRCSSCASQGLNWMFFCSKQHQKLIWSTHKRLCGKPFLPSFEWPSLTKQEVQQLPNRLVVALATSFDFGDGFECSLADISEDEEGSKTRSRDTIQAAIAKVRSISFTILFDEVAGASYPVSRNAHKETQLMAQHPLNFMITIEDQCWEELSSQQNLGTWWSVLHHRLLILISLTCEHYRDVSKIDEHLCYISHAHSIVNEILDESVSQNCPAGAASLKAKLAGMFTVTAYDAKSGQRSKGYKE